MQTILSLENTILGQDAYVVGGGKSLDFYPKGFFDGRFVLAVNQASRIVPADYIVRKEFTGKSLCTLTHYNKRSHRFSSTEMRIRMNRA